MKHTTITKNAIIIILIISMFSFNAYAVNAYANYSEICNSKIDDKLQESMSNSIYNQEFSVTIWFDTQEIKVNKASIIESVYSNQNISTAEQIENLSVSEKLNIVHEIREKNAIESQKALNNYISKNLHLINKYSTISYISKYAPCIKANLTSKEIVNLSKNQNITNIYLSETIESEQLLNKSREAIRAHTVQTNSILGQTGDGVRIGLIDEEFPDLRRDALASADIVLNTTSTSYPTENHATHTAEIIVSQGSNICAKGIAPDATLYCTTVHNNSEGYFNSLDWLVDKGVDIVNISLDWSILDSNNNPIRNQYYSYSQILDYYSAQYLITFVVANGNSGTAGVGSPAMSYNAISVGNINDNNTSSVSDDSINATSSHINIANLTNIPSKPDLCAPGTNISVDTLSVSGTSFSAPHVAGAAALIGEVDPLLLLSPVAIKATLIAGVSPNFRFVPSQRTVTTNTSNPPESYIQCGAGLIDCRRSAMLAKSYQADFAVFNETETEFSFTITCSANAKTRVALAFEKTTPMVNDIIHLYYMDNLDLYVYSPTGQLIGSSTTTNNNVEIVDFTASVSGEYTVKIKRVATENPSDVRFAYAWL